jgi:hypothetical protein
LNREWHPAYGGALELWRTPVDGPVRAIAPAFNRAVIFRAGPASLHGVPTPLTCPPERSRKSLAVYYFREEGRACALRPTRYSPRPTDSAVRRALVRVDGLLLWGYAILKRYTRLGDRLVSRILSRL